MAKAKTMQRGYRDVGYLFAARVEEFRPRQFNARLWRQRTEHLRVHVGQNSSIAIRKWFQAHYPALMHLIPDRRHREFVAGIVEGFEMA